MRRVTRIIVVWTLNGFRIETKQKVTVNPTNLEWQYRGVILLAKTRFSTSAKCQKSLKIAKNPQDLKDFHILTIFQLVQPVQKSHWITPLWQYPNLHNNWRLLVLLLQRLLLNRTGSFEMNFQLKYTFKNRPLPLSSDTREYACTDSKTTQVVFTSATDDRPPEKRHMERGKIKRGSLPAHLRQGDLNFTRSITSKLTQSRGLFRSRNPNIYNLKTSAEENTSFLFLHQNGSKPLKQFVFW